MGQTQFSKIVRNSIDEISKYTLYVFTMSFSCGFVNTTVVLSGTAIMELFTRPDIRVDN